MRKKAILKKYGSRKNYFKILRETNLIRPFIDYYGNEIMINPVKHFLKQEPYKNLEMNKEMVEIAKRFSSYINNIKKEQQKENTAPAEAN